MSLYTDIPSSLGSYYSKETIDEEFKEFHPRTLDKYFSENEIKKIYEDPTFMIDKNTFNKMIKENIQIYIKNYLPKYIGNYSAANMSGKLHIGISDDGIIEGIPYFGDKIPEKLINNIINQCFKNFIRINKKYALSIVDDETVLNWFKTNLKLEITKLEINPDLLDDFYLERLKLIKLDLKNRHDAWFDYRIKFCKWYNEMCKYGIKLRTIINNIQMRKNIIMYIKSYAKENNLNIDFYQKALDFYYSDEQIDFDITVEILEKNIGNFNSPYTWLIMFKDFTVEKIKLNKPRPPINRPFIFNYLRFAKHISNLKSYLVNNKCNFFVITFIIPKDSNYSIIEYKDIHGNWFCKRRTIDHNGPKAEEILFYADSDENDDIELLTIDF